MDLERPFVLEKDEKPIGYFRYVIVTDRDESTMYLRVIAIKEEWQNKGFGQSLFKYVERRQKGTNYEYLMIMSLNTFPHHVLNTSPHTNGI